MNGILAGIGQFVALPFRLLEWAALAILGALIIIVLVGGFLLGIVAVLADEGAKRAMRWGQS